MFVDACECSRRVYSNFTGPGHGRMLSVRCCAAVHCLPGRDVRSEFILQLVSHILRGFACATAIGMGSPSSVTLYVYASMCACTAIGMCSPSIVPIVVGSCLRACVAFIIYGPSGVLVVQRCACVCLHSARRVLSKP